MLTAFIILSVISLLILAAAVIIISGRGDDLIVGYNLASRKSQECYHRRRVRVIVGILLILIALLLPAIAVLLIKGYQEIVMTALPPTVFVLIASTFTAAHFWAKKKDK